jgi:hypothetical protein
MGISWTIDKSGWDGDIHRQARLTGSFDTSYTAGGESLTPADAGLGTITEVTVLTSTTESGYSVRYDHDSDDVMLFREADTGSSMAEVSDGTDVSSETVDLKVRGRS